MQYRYRVGKCCNEIVFLSKWTLQIVIFDGPMSARSYYLQTLHDAM